MKRIDDRRMLLAILLTVAFVAVLAVTGFVMDKLLKPDAQRWVRHFRDDE